MDLKEMKKEKYVDVLCPANDQYKKALDYCVNLLAHKFQLYDEQWSKNNSKSANQLQGQKKLEKLEVIDPCWSLIFGLHSEWHATIMIFTMV